MDCRLARRDFERELAAALAGFDPGNAVEREARALVALEQEFTVGDGEMAELDTNAMTNGGRAFEPRSWMGDIART